MKYQSEMARGWAAAQRDRGSGPAVDLISPMVLPAGKACLPNMIHMCYILSELLPGFVALSRDQAGGRCGCVCVHYVYVLGQLESALTM